ncbi:Ig-like domain-containing protein [Paucibacter soli]|uniref:Ig-like domain-containing protein n=1 Tax=Paucibacter soli TaxID=3133433 RepID=UPI0030B5E503
MSPIQKHHGSTSKQFGAEWLLASVLALAGCGGGLDPILGSPGAALTPAVSATMPQNLTPIVTGVDTHILVRATFNKPMQGTSITATSFTLACPSATPLTATVAYDDATRTATLTPAAALPPSTTCVATLNAAIRDSAGIALANAYIWSFVTGTAAALDVTRPTVVFTVPASGAAAVATNSQVSATFSEAMLANSLNATSFTLRNTTAGTAVAGSVSYNAASRTAVFTPAAPGNLASDSLFTVSITSAATDLAGNGLAGNTALLPNAGNHVWTFSTGAAADATPPTITTVGPADGSTLACLSKTVSATFSEPMDASTISASTFGVSDGGVAVAGLVSYDAANGVASFAPSAAAGFTPSHNYLVTVLGGSAGVKDLAGNPMASSRTWTFGSGTQACQGSVALGTAASFGAFGGGAGVTNQGINTVVAGNLGTTAACSLITGFHDAANVYTETTLNSGAVNGSINCGPPAPGTNATLAVATQARNDAQAAYNTLAAMPPGSDPGAGQLGGLVLAPGVYTAAGGTFEVTSGALNLDAQGDVNAVWVFQSAAALTVGLPATPRQVLLLNGAQARNVYWQVGSAARIEAGSSMVGTIIAPAGVTISTAGQTQQTTLVGRAIGLNASVTLVNTTIVAP